MSEISYKGQELDLFLAAKNWKSYWSSQINPHIGENVLEVGAGKGSNTPYLCSSKQLQWTSLEPDAYLASQIPKISISSCIQKTIVGTVADLPVEQTYDTILYIDVLEHIEKDQEELIRALSLLKSGGKLIVLSPAYPALFTQFDEAIGHFRRYTKKSLRAITPPASRLLKIYYLDSIGVCASLANKMLLRQSMPTQSQIHMWDSRIIPLSQFFDRLLAYQIGKSVVAVWTTSSLD